MATGTGLVSYHSLSGDLTSVSFSSIRSGTLDERNAWMTIQNWYIAAKERIFEAWLERALINDPDLRTLPYAKFDKFNAPVYGGRRWDWVDPKSDVAAARESVALGIKSRAEIIRASGRDPDAVWAELKLEKELGMLPPQSPGAAAQAEADEKPKKDKSDD
jgi:capsid protein